MPNGSAGATEGFARWHSASPGFSRSLRGDWGGGEGTRGAWQPWSSVWGAGAWRRALSCVAVTGEMLERGARLLHLAG